MVKIRVQNAKDVRQFLAQPRSLLDLEIDGSQNKTFVFPGVRYLNSLLVTGKCTVEFPDLELIVGGLFIGSGIQFRFPSIQSIGHETIDLTDDPENLEEFAALKFNKNPMVREFPEQLHVGSVLRKRSFISDSFVILANDYAYSLKYSIDSGVVTAGCRWFTDIDEAIEHWKSRLKSYETGADDGLMDNSPVNRAIMFIFALTNLKESLK